MQYYQTSVEFGHLEAEVEIAYTINPAYRGSRIDPPEPAGVNVVSWEIKLAGKPLEMDEHTFFGLLGGWAEVQREILDDDG
jgi:hypothetical protein